MTDEEFEYLSKRRIEINSIKTKVGVKNSRNGLSINWMSISNS